MDRLEGNLLEHVLCFCFRLCYSFLWLAGGLVFLFPGPLPDSCSWKLM